jgi:hemolysin III
MPIDHPRTVYSRAERISDAAVHIVGLSAVAVAVPILILVTALRRGDAAAMWGTSVYSACLVAMLSFSALYNMVDRPGWSSVLRRLDHCGIYFKIAGTYTPFTLLTGQGAILTALVWAGAALGSALKAFDPNRFRWIGLVLYLLLGWAGVLAGHALIGSLTTATLVLMMVGGGLYTLGVVAYLANRLPFHNTVWHVFVLAASFVFYAAVTVQVVAGMPGA